MTKFQISAFMSLSFVFVSISNVHASKLQGKSPNEDPLVTVETLTRFSPQARVDLVYTIVREWPRAKAAGITTPNRIYQFITEMATETGGFRLIAENLNYSAARLLKVFPRRVTTADAQQLEHNPVAIANFVYNGRLGNRPPSDGWTYRGSGFFQLTGRSNFAERGKELSQPLEANPEMVRTPTPAFQTAVAYWKARKLNRFADDGDLTEVRKAVNGGLNGLPEARIWLARAHRYLRPGGSLAAGPHDEEKQAIEGTLQSLGFMPLGAPKGGTSALSYSDALKAFQKSRGLQETGKMDDETLYEITSPDNFKSEIP